MTKCTHKWHSAGMQDYWGTAYLYLFCEKCAEAKRVAVA